MATTGYSLLIIDDQFKNRKEDYVKILTPDFNLDFAKNEYNIDSDIDRFYDAYILDLILTPDWTFSSATILKEKLSRTNVPIFLLSARWKIDDDVVRLLREMAIGNPQIVGLLDWDDFSSDKPYSRPNIIESITVSLDKWHRREGRSPNNREEITLLHVSDCQISDPAFSFVSQGVEEHITRILEDTSDGADLVILSGDIAYSGSPKEYTKAVDWCKKLMEASLGDRFEGCHEDRLLIVPGNHDVDLCTMGSDSIEYDFSALSNGKYPVKVANRTIADQRSPNGELNLETYPRAKMGLYAFENFARQVSTYSCIESIEGAYIENFLNWGIDIVLVSTVGLTSILETQSVGTQQSVLDKISKQTRRKNGKEKAYRILVTHHPPPEVLNADPSETANWIPAAWDSFRGWVGRLEPDLWLAGHTHRGASIILSDLSGKKGLPCLVAPTLTLKQVVRAEDELRGFSVIKLLRENDKINKAVVQWYTLKGSEKPKLERAETFPRES